MNTFTLRPSIKSALGLNTVTAEILAYSASILVAAIFIATSLKWPGSFASYALLSLAFNWLFFDAILKQHSAGYLFLAAVMWIGFWLKFSVNTIFSTVWMEPIGTFDFSVQQVDHVAVVASIGALGALLAGALFNKLSKKSQYSHLKAHSFDSRYYWIAGLLAVAIMSTLNEVYQIVQAFRPSPVLNLPFRLQGLITWYFGGGWSILLMIPFYRSFCAQKDVQAVFLLVFAGVIVSTTVFSRGVLVFQALIILLPLLVYRDFLPKPSANKLTKYLLIIFFGVCVSVIAAMERRSNFFESVAPERATSLSSSTWFYIAKLPIDRWIGLEALMAVTAYEGKSLDFFFERLSEKRVPGQVDFYTHKIALNPTTDTNTVNYSTPPGFIAFSYFSGSKWFVGVFSFVLALLLLSSERLVLWLSKNPFLATAIGIGLTVQIIHLGTGGLANPIKIFATSLTIAAGIGWLHRKILSRQISRSDS
ncbi:hypothetical protein [Hydrogenophaga sp.]|uniref:hypothetical protein n=1 Tax=Hydrogenophaga sp. TaxID=1904254 RepID=UPI0027224694|nr:hypothetical protein [Hydrogenophaga sp.]MDO9132640.1 hypothetical protein [Hydrogenophaga sp.]